MALCGPPIGATDAAPAGHRYVWFFIESLAHARLAWEEVDSSADSQNPVVRLARLKLAVEDFQCAEALVQVFHDTRSLDKLTTTSAKGAALAYKIFARGAHRWATALARGERLTIEEAANLKVENEKAAEFLLHSTTAAGFALLKGQSDSAKPMDQLTLTRTQRTTLREALKSRFPTVGNQTISENTHPPDLAAELLNKLLSNPRYKAADEP